MASLVVFEASDWANFVPISRAVTWENGSLVRMSLANPTTPYVLWRDIILHTLYTATCTVESRQPIVTKLAWSKMRNLIRRWPIRRCFRMKVHSGCAPLYFQLLRNARPSQERETLFMIRIISIINLSKRYETKLQNRDEQRDLKRLRRGLHTLLAPTDNLVL